METRYTDSCIEIILHVEYGCGIMNIGVVTYMGVSYMNMCVASVATVYISLHRRAQGWHVIRT